MDFDNVPGPSHAALALEHPSVCLMCQIWDRHVSPSFFDTIDRYLRCKVLASASSARPEVWWLRGKCTRLPQPRICRPFIWH